MRPTFTPPRPSSVPCRRCGGAASHAAALAAAAAEPSGLAWAAYPKRSSGVETDITRDRGWDALRDAGLRPVRQVAIDDTWSALRFRRQEHSG